MLIGEVYIEVGLLLSECRQMNPHAASSVVYC